VADQIARNRGSATPNLAETIRPRSSGAQGSKHGSRAGLRFVSTIERRESPQVTTDDSKSGSDDSKSGSAPSFIIADPSRVIDLDAVMEKAGGEVAARWRQTNERQELWQTEQRLEKIRLDELPNEELQAEVVAALTKTERILSETTIDDVLASHGWSERLASTLSARLAVIRANVESGSYPADSPYSELGRTLIEEIDPKAEDALKDAVYECQFLLRALSRRLHPE